jgi:mono/diheme cytochrome c family protein
MRAVALPAIALVVGSLALGTSSLSAQDLARGQTVYVQWCAACHGLDGTGNGPAATHMLPRPRDFTRAIYQIRTTATGEVPTDADILHVINVGMPGTTMPGWEDELPQADRQVIILFVSFYLINLLFIFFLEFRNLT